MKDGVVWSLEIAAAMGIEAPLIWIRDNTVNQFLMGNLRGRAGKNLDFDCAGYSCISSGL